MTVTVDTLAALAADTTVAPFVYGEVLLGDALIHQKATRRPANRAALVAALAEALLSAPAGLYTHARPPYDGRASCCSNERL
jgi:hypothetical protein